jgi:oligoribonuclease (3'-5' exoribonuclease)
MILANALLSTVFHQGRRVLIFAVYIMNIKILNEKVVTEVHSLKKYLQYFNSWQYKSHLKDSLIAVWEGDL